MRYSKLQAVNEVYELIARLFEPEAGPAEAKPDQAFTVAGALVELGEANSWASVWFAYGALHHDLSDEALMRALTLMRALELLDHVDASATARAAALMLKAEAAFSLATYREDEPDRSEQVALLDEAVELAPDWPSLHLRLPAH